jgi:quercetin dioxygenase-like cupin family protein
MRLFGLMVVRNAADLLPVSLQHHLAQGVERFLVLDHASTDGTAELLQSLARRLPLEWSAVDGPFRVEHWMNDLALEASLQGADWVLPIDADEFWIGTEGIRVGECLAATGAGALQARVVNFVQQHDQIASEPEGLLRMTHRVGNPFPCEEGKRQVLAGSLPFIAAAYPPKWLSRAATGLRIWRGNHGVEGVEGPKVPTERIVCLHAPLRSRAALRDRQQPLPVLDPDLIPGLSWHLKRWKEMGAEASVVDQEWRANSAVGGRLLESGAPLVRDTRLCDALRPWLNGFRGAEPRPASAAAPPRTAAVTGGGSGRVAEAREKALWEGLGHLRTRLAQKEKALAEREVLVAGLQTELAARGSAAQAAQALRAEVDSLRLESGRREAAVTEELALLREVRASKTWRLWMASIRLRRALGLAARPRPALKTKNRSGATASTELAAELAQLGFAGPLPIFSAPECQRLLRLLRADPPRPREWDKDLAVGSRLVYEIAALPAIARVVEAVLGAEVVLWGASLVERAAGQAHPWHTDIESFAAGGGCVSVWIGLENVTRDSSLRIVPRSHRFGVAFQQVAHANGLRRGEARDADAARWARERDRRGAVVATEMVDGDALFFDGRLWHASVNETSATRTTLLLQYAAATRPVRIPDLSALEWPFRMLEEPRPPCIRIAGANERQGANRVVAPPPRSGAVGLSPLAPLARPIAIPAEGDPVSGWKPHPLFHGSTPNLASLHCHFSVLGPDRQPHPPHEHAEEELLLLLDGEAELVLVDGAGHEERYRARRGQLAYYPAGQRHTLRTLPGRSATYFMLKWTGRDSSPADALAAGVLRTDPAFAAEVGSEARGFAPRLLFEGPTRYLERLHCHGTTLASGAGYAPHIDDHDVAIVVLAGRVEAIGERIEENGVLFVPAGAPHGMRNPGSVPARYLVFEFHGRSPHAVDAVGCEHFEPGTGWPR